MNDTHIDTQHKQNIGIARFDIIGKRLFEARRRWPGYEIRDLQFNCGPAGGENLALRVEEVVAEAKLAESMGFDSCFFGEHHQDKDGFLPAPLIVAATVAAQTTKLNLGTSVILLPLHHPVKLAEEVITLDIVSRGRFILGVGLGYQPVDFRTFDIPIEQRVSRFEEEIEIIRQCWKGERFDFSGEHFNLEDIAITPRPYSDPSPPLWIGASRAPGARRAGTIADGFVAGPSTDLESTITLTSAYQQAAQAVGKEPVLCLMRDSWVAPTRAEAEQVYGPAVIDAYKYYWRNGLNEFRRHTVESDINMTNMAPDRLIIGEPEEVVGDFHRWKEATGADYFLLRLRHAHSGGPPHERIMEAIQLFGEEVIPNCQ